LENWLASAENGLATFFQLFSALQALKRQPCNPEMEK
jgi:hypothetical protein